jgi:hypothetical protein
MEIYPLILLSSRIRCLGSETKNILRQTVPTFSSLGLRICFLLEPKEKESLPALFSKLMASFRYLCNVYSEIKNYTNIYFIEMYTNYHRVRTVSYFKCDLVTACI